MCMPRSAAGSRCRPCPVTYVLVYRREDAAPALRQDSLANSRSLSNPRSFHQKRPLGFRERSEEHTSELQSHLNLVCRLLLEKKKLYTSSYYFCVVEVC